jgi:hypothetical protein
MHSSSRMTIFRTSYPAPSLAVSRRLETRHAPFAPRMAHGPHHGTLPVADDVADGVAHAVARKPSPRCSLWAAGARPSSITARATALMLRKDASGLRALGLKPASLLRTAHVSLPAPRSRRAPAAQGRSQRRRGAQDQPSRRCERSLRSGMCAPALPRPTGRLSLAALGHTSRPVGRASRSQNHRLSRAWERSFPCRSLGLAPASAVTGSVSAGALPSPFAAWGRLITSSPALGGLRKLSLKSAKVFARFAPVARATYAFRATGAGCERSPENSPRVSNRGSIAVQTLLLATREYRQFIQRS